MAKVYTYYTIEFHDNRGSIQETSLIPKLDGRGGARARVKSMARDLHGINPNFPLTIVKHVVSDYEKYHFEKN